MMEFRKCALALLFLTPCSFASKVRGGQEASQITTTADMSYVTTPPKVVYIVRHGEKANCGYLNSISCLSETGHARADYIATIFGGTVADHPHHPFACPDALFSCNYDDYFDCGSLNNPYWGTHNKMYRTEQTIFPLSQQVDLSINTEYGFMPQLGNNAGAALAIKKKLAEPGVNIIVVAWEHQNIIKGWFDDDPGLAVGLGASADDLPDWPSTDYDTLFAMYYDEDVNFVRILKGAENFNAQPEYQYLLPEFQPSNPCTPDQVNADNLLFVTMNENICQHVDAENLANTIQAISDPTAREEAQKYIPNCSATVA